MTKDSVLEKLKATVPKNKTELQQEYTQLCAHLGQIDYRISRMNEDKVTLQAQIRKLDEEIQKSIEFEQKALADLQAKAPNLVEQKPVEAAPSTVSEPEVEGNK